ncbi:MAG: galactose-1-phosphate uridylyltransferase [Fimbriimonas ginsengisoli]|uniref:Galactose-1-phosphate uridylyltransferase n=1 Tax=Fimbriimonas ginsengisoli TaxID=1005039 RepID=A0A931LU94_FIMGI|nr:galactose-1-phosphate uridylyltransferase [Fimbriimonas ginsengisoli]
MPELEFHPFLRQWVIVAADRQERPFLPSAGSCPLCPTREGGPPTEVPLASYDLAVFENRFPSLGGPPLATPGAKESTGSSQPVRASGVCEVVCYTDRHEGCLADLPPRQAGKLVRVWRDRYESLAAREDVRYVFIFENRGVEIGVTLTHPHGQIYGYPFIPPVPLAELEAERAHVQSTGGSLFGEWLAFECEGQAKRRVWTDGTTVAVVPFFARYPFEVHVAPLEQRRSLAVLSEGEMDSLAEGLQSVARAYDRLFDSPMPYVMSMHQEPATPGYEHAWLHVEFTPIRRDAWKLKYLSGSETGAGVFIADMLPEDAAARLRAVI